MQGATWNNSSQAAWTPNQTTVRDAHNTQASGDKQEPWSTSATVETRPKTWETSEGGHPRLSSSSSNR